jgi:SAM-dependent methyltransferase
MFEKKFMGMFYGKAKSPQDLPWHSETPARLLVEAVQQRRKAGRALDIGCGTGVHAIYLAQHGYDVTGLDFIPKALEMAAARANTENTDVNWVHTDVLDWKSADPERLLQQARAGQEAALGQLLERYRNYLALLARLQIGRRLQGVSRSGLSVRFSRASY